MLLSELFSPLSEGINDPHIFKALFIIGAPGSGKSTVSNALARLTGLRKVNPDDFYELSLKKRGIEQTKLATDLEGDPEWIRSKLLKDKKLEIAIDSRLGLLVDGTGRYSPAIIDPINQLRSLGYDVAMLYVQVDLETAIARQQLRNRQVDELTVRRYHRKVTKNARKFEQLFTGKNAGKFAILNNSENIAVNQVINSLKFLTIPDSNVSISANRWFQRWLNQPVNNAAVQSWKKSQSQPSA